MPRKSASFYFKESILLVIKLALSIVLVNIAIRKINLADLRWIFSTVSWSRILLLCALIMFNWAFQIIRWGIILKEYSESVKWHETIKSFFIGHTFRLVIPGGYAEFLKIYYLNGKHRHGFMAYLVELSIVMLTQIILLVWAGLHLFPHQKWIFISIGIVSIGACAGFPYLKKIRFVKKYLPNPTIRWSLILKSGVLTIFSLILISSEYHFIINWASSIPWPAAAQSVIFILFANSVPFTFGGLGVRENVAVYLFGLFGITAPVSVATSLFVFVTNSLMPAFIGLVLMLLHRVVRRTPVSPVQPISPKA